MKTLPNLLAKNAIFNQLKPQELARLSELARLLVRRMQRASNIVEELAFQPVAGRLAKLLFNRFGETAGERVTRNLTLDEMAAHIGSTREMVCRILHRFAENGLIEITRTEFRLPSFGLQISIS